MDMEIYSTISTILTLFMGGGWFIHWRAGKRKANGEATQAEADGWAKQQEVYQNTIADQQKFYDHLKADFNVVIEENSKLRKENNEWREKVNDLENTVFDLKKEISRLDRRVEALSKEKKEVEKNANTKERK